MKSRPEILAPCGNMSSLKAAIAAGADACYLAGNSFGARAYADNFSSDELIEAIDLAHLYGVKIYLTCNTLIKNNEVPLVYDMLVPIYEAGLDAVLIQDFGIMRLVRETFPGLEIHTSTQMNILTPEGASLAKEMGASRVVAAREMNIQEIARIKDKAGVEVEAFVHGAMCLCYSGRCLMSSMMGGRSGNRGRCAQPCRQKYNGEYLMSMRDLCSLEYIPDMVDAGIDSLKIEGRMKNEYYTAATVEAYRTLVDEYIEGRFDPERVKFFNSRLLDIFNRGGFSSGYMNRTPERTEAQWDSQLIDSSMPGRRGVKLGSVSKVSGGTISFKAEKNLDKQDELLIDVPEPISITSNVSAMQGEFVTLNAPETKRVSKGTNIYRTRSKVLVDYYEKLLADDKKISISGKVKAVSGEKLTISFTCNDVSITEEGPIVGEATNRPIDEETIRSKVSGLGNTLFTLEKLDVEMGKCVFVRIGDISELRRRAIESLSIAICGRSKRDSNKVKSIDSILLENVDVSEKKKNYNGNDHVYGFSYPEQLDVFLREYPQELTCISGDAILMLDAGLGGYDTQSLKNSIDKLIEFKKEHLNVRIYLGQPHIDRCGAWIRDTFDGLSSDSDGVKNYLDEINGLYIRSIDDLAFSIKLFKNKDFILANSLYAYNDLAVHEIRSLLEDSYGFSGKIWFESSLELTLKEVGELMYNTECFAMCYGKIPLMVTAGLRDTEGVLQDSKGHRLDVVCGHGLGYNVILNDYPLSLHEHTDSLIRYKLRKFVSFTDETPDEVLDVINDHPKFIDKKRYTLGHTEKGI